jgi:hypothetical protein
MKRVNAAAAVACGAILATVIAGTAAADTRIFPFHDCVGPTGTPTSFTAEKTETQPVDGTPTFSQATGYRLTDGSAVFIALIRGDIHNPPGIDVSGAATTTCLVDTPLRGTVRFWGFLTAAN